MKIVRYKNSNDIDIQFLDEHGVVVKNRTYQSFCKGSVHNPYDKTIYGIGFLGEGDYLTSGERGTKSLPEYIAWKGILARCYHTQRLYTAYYGKCTVCDEWFNYQNFAKWFNDNKYECPGRLHIDKDILSKGNKIYSPETCLLVPQRINMIFMHKTKTIDADLPNGINRSYLLDGTIRYRAIYNGKRIGTFDNIEECIESHNKVKYIMMKSCVFRRWKSS